VSERPCFIVALANMFWRHFDELSEAISPIFCVIAHIVSTLAKTLIFVQV